MALTISRQETEIVTKEWQKILSTSTTATLTSTEFMQKLAIIGLSNITYSRDVFPSQCYEINEIEQMVIPILKENTLCKESNLFYKWIKSAFGAFEKRYLKKMTLGFYEDGSRQETVIETYSFRFKYGKEQFIIESKGKNREKKSIFTNTVKQSTEELIKCSTLFFHSMDPLPEDYDIILHLFYNDGITPADYEPEGFVPCHDDLRVDGFTNYEIGSVITTDHKLKLLAHRKCDADMQIYRNTEVEESIEERSQRNMVSQITPVDDNSNAGKSLQMDFDEMSLSATNSGAQKTSQDDIRCPCTLKLDGDQCMVNCTMCKSWQHAACFGLFAIDESLLQIHICDVCAAQGSGLICTDPNLNNMTAQKKKEMCLFRSILAYCVFYRAIDVALFMEMFSFSQRNTLKVLQRLSAYGIIQFSMPSNSDILDYKESYNINLPRLKENAIPKFFPYSSIDVLSQSDNNSHLSRSQNYYARSRTSTADNNEENISPILNFPLHTTPRAAQFIIPRSEGRKSNRMRKTTKRYHDEIYEDILQESKKPKRSTTQLSLKKKDINI